MFKKIIAGVALGAALVMGGQVAYINQAEAVDVYAGEQTKFDISSYEFVKNNGEWYGCEDGNKASKNPVKSVKVYQIIFNACLNNL